MFLFSAAVKNHLYNAGWYENRKIDIRLYEEAVRRENYEFPIAVQTFLEEFGGLKIIFYLKNGKEDFMHFDTIKAVNDTSSLWIQQDYAKRINNNFLCPIGQVYSNHMTLVMDDKGGVYGGFDNEFFMISTTGEGAIESIYTNSTFDKIK